MALYASLTNVPNKARPLVMEKASMRSMKSILKTLAAPLSPAWILYLYFFSLSECNTSMCTTEAPRCTLGFEVHSHIPSGQCCPVYQCVPKRVCVHQNAEFLPNSSVFVDKCQNCFCTNEVNVSTQLNIISCEHIPCNTYCEPPGEFKNDPYNNCTIYSCVNIHNQLISSTSEITCPAFNEESCKPGTITFLPNGCCKTCAPLDSSTQCSVRQREDFITYKGCRSVDRVVMTECEGTCGTFSL
ncbi:hypothetical protein Q9233_003044 [Columba guinea]|nr:hypothetical protein Q9233_003044 [Columba guinea]